MVRDSVKIAAALLLALIVLTVVYAIFSPHATWYSRVWNARITADGKEIRGSLHRSHQGEALFLTRRDKSKAESYLIWAHQDRRGLVLTCGRWTAPRLPLFVIGDVNPPCWPANDSDNYPSRISPNRKLVVGAKIIEFTADDDSRITASW
jgi:hypothetical protein